MSSLSKRPPPPPPPKPKHLAQSRSSTKSTSRKKGLGWPWDQPSSHFALYMPSTADSIPGNTQTTTTNPSSQGVNSPISWLFNWELWVPPSLPPSIEWTPCVRTASQISDLDPFLTDIIFNQKKKVTALLGFNEPEIASQANLSVDDAVKLWIGHVIPAKSKFGLRLGSPGMCSDMGLCVPWLDRFFNAFISEQDGPRQQSHRGGNGEVGNISPEIVRRSGVDFLVLHWYGTSLDAFCGYVQGMHERYGLPVWVNEFACSSTGNGGQTSEEQVKDFMTEAVRWLEETDWVERYAYYGLGQGSDVGSWVGSSSNFSQSSEEAQCKDTGGRKLSDVGKLYMRL